MSGQRVSLSGRLAHAGVAASCLVILGWYGVRFVKKPDLADYYADPETFDGRELIVGAEAKIIEIDDGEFVVHSLGHTIRVPGRVRPDDLGRFVFVRGIFHREGWIDPIAFRVARGRRVKIWLSVLPTFWVGWLLLRGLRIDRAHWSLEPRESA